MAFSNQGPSQWTTVHHGRRRQRQDSHPQDRSGGGNRGMDRAPPGSSTGWAYFPFPNQPVPPSGSNRYFGPNSRSYASVARGQNFGYAPTFPQGRLPAAAQTRYQPTDPRFGRLVRKLYAVVKMVHHLQNVAPKPGKPEPRMISRMVDILSSVIKPAFPTPGTEDLIRGNATNWGYTTLLLLEDHYMSSLENLLRELEQGLAPDWKQAFEVAKRWAMRNLPRITQEVMDHAEALIMSRTETDRHSQDTSAPPPDSNTRTQLTHTHCDAQQQTSVLPSTSTGEVGASHHPLSFHTVSTMTDQVPLQTAPAPQAPQHEQPLEQRQPRRGRTPHNCVVSEDSVLFDIEEEGDSQNGTAGGEASVSPRSWLLDEDVGEGMARSPMLTPLRDSRFPTHGLLGRERDLVQVHAIADVSYDEELQDSLTSTPATPLCRVTRHVRTERKMIDWTLSVQKKWLIVGDSNLSRIPPYSIPDLQIDSYPGANFRHAQALMAKSTCQVRVVEKVVLSFGLNCRGQRAKETAVKQMQGAVRAVKKHFPYAEIWLPVINYSTLLPLAERTTLHTLNGHIMRNLPFIPALGGTVFHTDTDNIHWTGETGKAMLEHWASYLNLGAP